MQTVADRPEAPTAIRTDLGAIFVSLELSRSTWLMTSLSPGGGEKMSKQWCVVAMWPDYWSALRDFARKRGRGRGRSSRSSSFRRLTSTDSGSIARCRIKGSKATSWIRPRSRHRRRRRAKTDGIDGEMLVRARLAYKRGEPGLRDDQGTYSRGRGPPPPLPRAQDADRRAGPARQSRQGAAVHTGISGYEPLRRDRRRRLDTLQTGDGRLLPDHLKAQVCRELNRLELLLEQIKAVEAERDVPLAAASQRISATLRGLLRRPQY